MIRILFVCLLLVSLIVLQPKRVLGATIVTKTEENIKTSISPLNGNSWSPNSIYITGQLSSSTGNFFSGILLKSPNGDTISNLQFHLEARPLNENTNFPNTVTSLVVLLVANKNGHLPKSSDVVPNIPGALPWEGVQQVPQGSADFTTSSGSVYRFKNEVIYGETFYPNNANSTGCCRYITRYMMHNDPRIDHIRLDIDDELMVLVKYGSQDQNLSGFSFTGRLNWEYKF